MKYQQVQRSFGSHYSKAELRLLSFQKRPKSGCSAETPGIALPILLVVSGAMLICSFYLLKPLFLTPVSQIWAARSWSKTGCRIESVDMLRAGRVTYRPKVRYSYSVGGRSLVGSAFQFNQTTWLLTGFQAEDFVKRYTVGHHVPCYANPHFPEQSVIMRSITSTFLLEFLVIGTLLGFPLILLLRLPYRFAEKHFNCPVESHLMSEVRHFEARLGNISGSGQYWQFLTECFRGSWLLLLLSPWILRTFIILTLTSSYIAWIVSVAIGQ